MSIIDRRVSDTSTKSSQNDTSFKSVEELFQTMSIKEIQTLNHQYQQDALAARSDLQSLVSNKYRDLIAITNQITETYESTKTFESGLSDLAFKPAKFVNFNTQGYTNIHHKISVDALSELQAGESNRVVNDLIYDKLLHLDCQLQKLDYSESPFLHTSNYIYFAKIYYILNLRFTDQINSNQLLKETFKNLKSNFGNFLRSQIACYNASRSLFNESDKSVLSEPFTKNHLISVNPLSEQIDDVEVHVEFKDNEHAHDLNFLLPEVFDQNASPLINYLLAFILLESSDTCMSRSTVLFEFITIRFEYLQSLLDPIVVDSSNYNKLNFFNIFKYIENTFDYISGYFENTDPKNSLLKALGSITKKWNIIDDIYIDLSNFKFNLDPMLVNLQSSSLKDLKESKVKFVQLIWMFFTDLSSGGSDTVGQLSQNLTLFKVLLMSFKKLELVSTDIGSKSQVIKLISEDDLLNGILKSVLSVCEKSYDVHLSTFENLLQLVSKKEEQQSDVEYSLFTTDFVDLINNNLSTYYDMVTKASMDFSFSFNGNIVDALNTWFDKSHDFFTLIDNGDSSSKNSFVLTELATHLSLESEINWGKFNKKKLLDEFSSLRTRLADRFWQDFDKFYKSLSSMVDEAVTEGDATGVYFLTKVLISLKQNLEKVDKVKDTRSNSIKERLSTCYDYLLSSVSVSSDSGISFFDQFESVIDSIIHKGQETSEDIDVSLQMLKLTTLMFRFSSKLLNHGKDTYQDDYKTGIIFTDKEGIFVHQKNKWIRDVLISKVYEQVESTKLTKQQISKLYACVLFLQHLTNEVPQVPLEKLSEYTEEKINELDFASVSEDIKELSSASRNTYYPLNL